MKNIFLYIFILALIASCKTRKQDPFGRATKLEDKKWILTTLNNKTITETDSLRMFVMEIFSEDNALYLSCECDTAYGLYTAHDDFVLLNVLGRTDVQCNPQLYGEFVQQAKSANHFQIKTTKQNKQLKEQLILFKDDQELMRLNKK